MEIHGANPRNVCDIIRDGCEVRQDVSTIRETVKNRESKHVQFSPPVSCVGRYTRCVSTAPSRPNRGLKVPGIGQIFYNFSLMQFCWISNNRWRHRTVD